MTSVTFDTLSFTRRLQEAGFDEKQAETVVRVLSAAQENLVTRDRFDSEIKNLCTEIKGELLLIKWMLALVVAVNVLPLLKTLFS
jgi:hypothetical protein